MSCPGDCICYRQMPILWQSFYRHQLNICDEVTIFCLVLFHIEVELKESLSVLKDPINPDIGCLANGNEAIYGGVHIKSYSELFPFRNGHVGAIQAITRSYHLQAPEYYIWSTLLLLRPLQAYLVKFIVPTEP